MFEMLKRFAVDWCYTIAIRKREGSLLFEGNHSVFSLVPISKKQWYADPMVFSYKGVDYLFCEVFDRKTEIGHIAVTRLDSVTPALPRKVLGVDSHLSYPCVFEHKDKIYMIPETTTENNIQLFQAKNFPDKWEFVCEVKKGGQYADSTYFACGERSFLLLFEQYFGNGSITKVSVHCADDIEIGKISPFPSQPFEYNSVSRGAGNLFACRESIIRPAQICTESYGYGLRFYQTSFKNGEYSEQPFCDVYPENIVTDTKKKILGTHTYALTEKYEIIDVKYNDPRVRWQIRRACRYVARKLRGTK